MNKRIIFSILVIVSFLMVTGCNSKSNTSNNQNNNDNNRVEDNNNLDSLNEVINSVKVIIDEEEYTINLEDNETVKSFIKMLPQELKMSELNGNEKYVYLDNTLSTNSYNPKRINAGDVMLYGNNCLVIFYKSFDTSYSYTKIGHIDNLPNLGNGSITVKLEL